jgi:hypothetical protein
LQEKEDWFHHKTEQEALNKLAYHVCKLDYEADV